MKWIGLTGGIGTGKSTVAQLLRARGCTVVDADQLARQAVAKNSEGFKQVVSLFGTQVLGPDGNLDRSRLGKLVFGDSKRLAELEKIIHPIVRRLALDERDRLAAQGLPVAFYDVPLLYEKGLETMFDQVVLVYAPESTQIERVMNRDGFSLDEAKQRVASQLAIEEKRRRAQIVLDNSGARELLERQVAELLERFKA
ncbi:MAG: dephospho-CoA kinase [Bdellovibrionaceae bacterium]|nr:dephospho-CoA kinase [Bdellovibrionales bacterium]MCB9084763.1 dephospho-CoA kinase [Pseudobdellovibrionaceae bacterium]